jgi:hypothetical protein
VSARGAGERCGLATCGDNCYTWSDTLVAGESQYTVRIPTIAHSGSVGISLVRDSDPDIPSATLYFTTGTGTGAISIGLISSATPTRISVPSDAQDFRIEVNLHGEAGSAFALKVPQGLGN